MPFKKIPQIQIGGGTYGGMVYSLNYTNNFTESPSQLSVQIISENGQYLPPDFNSLTNLDSTITIGNQKFLGELHDWTINEQVGERTLELKFIDKSVRLDRIWVSLFRRNEGRGGVKKTKFKTVSKQTTVPIFKAIDLGPNQGTYYYFTYETDTQDVQISRELREAFLNPYDLDGGGSIILGEEQWIENTCSIPNVLYNFTQLLGLCGNLVVLQNVAGINTSYYNSYTGTLRQVLQNWCADFGLTFYWDTSINKAVIRDAKIPFAIPNENSFNQGSIIRKSFGQSKEGSFAQYGLAWYEKEGQENRQIELSSTKYYPTYYYPFSLSFVYYQGNIFDTNGNSVVEGADLRAETEFLTSAMMGYYYAPFRKYYNWYELGVLDGNVLGKGATPLGISFLSEIISPDAVSLIISAFNQNNLQTTASFLQQRTQQFNPDNFQFYIGSYDPTIEENFQNYEVNIISNYIGKYYRGPTTNYGANTICDQNFFYKYERTENPGGQKYSYYQGNPPPFAQFLRNASQLSKIDNGEVQDINKGAQYNIFTRGGSFSHTQDEFLQQLGIYDTTINLIDEYLPAKLKIDGQVLDVFQQLQAQNLLPSNITPENLNNLYFFMVLNKQKIIDNLGLSVSYQGKRPNKNEQIAQIETAQNDISCQFTKFCISEDEEIEAKIRELRKQDVNSLFTNGQDQQPPVGLFVGGNRGYGVEVTFQTKSIDVVSPADGDFQGYSTIVTSVQAIDKTENEDNTGKIKIVKVGDVGNAPLVDEIRVVENNFTSEEVDNTSFSKIKKEMDAYVGGQSVYYAGPRKFLSITSTEYINTVSLNQGLESIETVIKNDGVEITYNLANFPPKIPSPNTILSQFENRKNRNSPR